MVFSIFFLSQILKVSQVCNNCPSPEKSLRFICTFIHVVLLNRKCNYFDCIASRGGSRIRSTKEQKTLLIIKRDYASLHLKAGASLFDFYPIFISYIKCCHASLGRIDSLYLPENGVIWPFYSFFSFCCVTAYQLPRLLRDFFSALLIDLTSEQIEIEACGRRPTLHI